MSQTLIEKYVDPNGIKRWDIINHLIKRNNYYSFEFLNEGYIFHLGSSTLAYMNLVNEFWSHFNENYNLEK